MVCKGLILLFVIVLYSTLCITQSTECTGFFDVMFVVDGSGSIYSSDWDLVKTFILSLSDSYDFNFSRMGLVQFSDDAQLEISFTHSKSDFDNVVNTMSQIGLSTNIPSGMSIGLTEFMNNDKENVLKIMIVLTDGINNEYTELLQPVSDDVKNFGISVFAIGVGGYDLSQLQIIASNPSSDYIFTFDEFYYLVDNINDILETTCLQITEITPDQICLQDDQRTLSITGSGFIDTNELSCKFNDEIIPATFISRTNIECLSPTSFTSQQIVEVSVSVNGIDYTFAGQNFGICSCDNGEEASCLNNELIVTPSTITIGEAQSKIVSVELRESISSTLTITAIANPSTNIIISPSSATISPSSPFFDFEISYKHSSTIGNMPNVLGMVTFEVEGNDDISGSLEVLPITCCELWSICESERPDRSWIDNLFTTYPCPCELPLVDNPDEDDILNSIDTSYSGWSMTGKDYTITYADEEPAEHSGAYVCIRSAILRDSGVTNIGQQCCYDRSYNLIQFQNPGQSSPGSADYGHWFCDAVGSPSHCEADVLPYKLCGNDNGVEHYFPHRPDDRRSCNGNIPSPRPTKSFSQDLPLCHIGANVITSNNEACWFEKSNIGLIETNEDINCGSPVDVFSRFMAAETELSTCGLVSHIQFTVSSVAIQLTAELVDVIDGLPFVGIDIVEPEGSSSLGSITLDTLFESKTIVVELEEQKEIQKTPSFDLVLNNLNGQVQIEIIEEDKVQSYSTSSNSFYNTSPFTISSTDFDSSSSSSANSLIYNISLLIIIIFFFF